MKYIRTEDEIYEVENDIEYVYKKERNHLLQAYRDVYEEFGEETNWTDLGEIIKQADTIEELCDEFVMVDEENEHYINQLNDIHHIRRKLAIGNYTVYGAIWTEHGLKYIAKMNEKGDLELL